MIEEISGVGFKLREIQRPSSDRNGQAEFALLVGFAAQWQEGKSLLGSELQQRPGNSGKRRRLVITTVKCTQYPTKFWDAQRGADARIGLVFDYASRKMRVANTSIEGRPVRGAKLFLGKECAQ